MMVQIVNKEKKQNVDLWDPSILNDIDDVVVKNVRGQIIWPIAEKIFKGNDDMKALNYFYMNSKRSYNSDEVRTHICRYINYFLKYYDTEKELLMIVFAIKQQIDYQKSYTLDTFIDDINRCIINNFNITRKIKRFVEDNYVFRLNTNNNTPNLQFNDRHAKILYEISFLINIYIPLATHFMFINEIKTSEKIQEILLRLFDLCNIKYLNERRIDMFSKLYETSLSVVNKSKGPDKVLWEKNKIRGVNTTTHTRDTIYDLIFNIIPKYTFIDDNGEPRSILAFNYYSCRKSLMYKVTDIKYEFQFTKLDSTTRDQDNNTQFDIYQARISKRNEALALQNKVAAEQTVKQIEKIYGPFSEEEINHYRKRLTKDGSPIINPLQKQIISYLYDKDFGDPVTINSINITCYIKLIIAGKRLLLQSGMKILPYIISSKVLRNTSRKIISKKDMTRMQSSEHFQYLKIKYNNEKIMQKIFDFIGSITSSTFEIIDWDNDNHCPSAIDGQKVPMINDIINEELLFFVSYI